MNRLVQDRLAWAGSQRGEMQVALTPDAEFTRLGMVAMRINFVVESDAAGGKSFCAMRRREPIWISSLKHVGRTVVF